MALSQLPSWLTPVSGRPGFYYHRGLNQCVPIEDEEVQQRYYEEQYDIQRREDSPPGSIDELIDLTDDTSVNAPPDVLRVPETARAKPDATFWIKGLAYLVRRLGSYGGSDRWRLFESMRSYPRKEKRHRYCELYWPSEEAAWDDITAKSRWFLDAEELFTYDLKWSRLETLASLESPSEGEIKEKVELEALVLADKKRLAEALKGKRETKIEQEDLAQSFNRLQTSKRAAFEKSTGMPKSIDNIKRAQRNLEEEILKQKTARQNGTTGKGKERARTTKKSSPKKRKAIVCEIRGGSPAKRSRSEEGQLSPTEEASPTVTQESTPESGDDIDAEGETDDETPVTAPNEEGDWEWDLEEVAKQLLEDDQPLAEPGSSISENVEAEMEDDAAEGDKEGSKYGEDMNEDFWESSEEEIVYSDLTAVYPV
ncbi:hypothetical protein E8E13_011427 [Curvularia kusanoi]|uniref:Uncharacterized protein n=1 Tax=Curvularia kusanoi TaxID=90978 RepID=A0A9P4TLU0_CURKU|nr:hypothetical protein E8E13_011427 [Curvularia kusanoi]